MAKSLSVIFNAVDNLSAKLSAIANVGRETTNTFSSIESSANQAFNAVEGGAEQAQNAIKQASGGMSGYGSTAEKAGNDAVNAFNSLESSAQTAFNTLNDGADAAENALGQTGMSTDALGETINQASGMLNQYGSAAEQAGSEVTGAFEQMESTAQSAFGALNDSAGSAGNALGQVASSADSWNDSVNQASDAMNQYGSIAEQAGNEAAGALEEIGNGAQSAFNAVNDSVENTGNIIGDAIGSVESWNDSINQAADSVNQYSTATEQAGSDVAGAFNEMGSTFENLSTGVEQTAGAFGEIESNAQSTFEALNNGIDASADAFGQIESNAQSTFDALTTEIESSAGAFEQIESNAQNVFESMNNEIDSSVNAFEQFEGNAQSAFGTVNDEAAGMADALNQSASSTDAWSDSINQASDAVNQYGSATEQAGSEVTSTFSEVETSAQSAFGSLNEEAISAGNSIQQAASSTDYWTTAVGNYDKGLLKAIYSTEELVDMGLKSAQAIKVEEDALNLCEKSASGLSKTMTASGASSDKLSSAMANAANTSKQLASNGNVAADAQNNLTKAGKDAQSAMENLAKAQAEAEGAMSAYDAVMTSGTADLKEIEAASERACQAAVNLSNANGEASEAAEKLSDANEEAVNALKKAEEESNEVSKAFKDAGDSSKEMGDKSTQAIGDLESMLASAGIVAALKGIMDAFSDCAEVAETYESSIAQLQTISGSSQINTLSDDILELSNSTGIAASDLAEVAYNAISAGTAVEDAVSMAESASKLATAGFTDTSSALSVLTTAINAYGDKAGTADEISDSLITVQNLGVTTVADLSSNMGKAIATASAYNVSLGNLESAYISTTKAGINTAESTTYLSSMMKELGDSGTDVSGILQDKTGESFGQLMDDGYSLADVLDILYDSVDGDSEALMNLWSSAEAGKAANAILSQGLEEFNDNLNAVENSAGATAAAYNTMADTTEYAHERMTNATENFKQAVGDSLNPALTDLYNVGTNVYGKMTEFADKYPIAIQAATALATGLVTLVGILTGYTVIVKAATIAKKLWTAATATATAGVALEVAVIGGLVVALGVLAACYFSAKNSEDQLTASSQKQKDELDALNSEYARAVVAYGSNSDEALSLKGQVDELSESYEGSKQTLSDFYDELDSIHNSHEDLMNTYNETNDAIEDQASKTENLTSKLIEYSSSSDDSAESQSKLEAVIAGLNEIYPELGLTVDDVNNSLSDSIDLINNLYNINTASEKYENAKSTLTGLVEEQDSLQSARDRALEQLEYAEKRYREAGAMEGTWAELTGTGVTAALDEAQQAFAQADEDLQENLDKQAECQDIIQQYESILNGTSEDLVGYSDAVSVAISDTKEYVAELIDAYNEAYNAALDSIEGQYDLWDKVGEIEPTSVENLRATLDAQASYWSDYADNLESLRSRNIDGLDDLLASMDDGSESSAAALEAMSNASDTELSAMVEDFQTLQEQQSRTADDMADLETNFSEKLADVEDDLTTTIENMNMDDEAKAAAEATMQAYIDAINNMKGTAVDSAEAVAAAVAAALAGNTYTDDSSSDDSTSTTPTIGTSGKTWYEYYDSQTASKSIADEWGLGTNVASKVAANNSIADGLNALSITDVTEALERRKAAEPTKESARSAFISGHANGTLDSEKIYIAGEEGPELIVSGGGDTVFPHEETNKIIAAVNDENNAISNPQLGYVPENDSTSTIINKNESSSVSEKTITLKIEGSGSLNVGQNTSAESIWDNIKDNLKSAIFNLLQEEVYEEGVGAYEY
jgi:TP901 family phage tail tape measure protein